MILLIIKSYFYVFVSVAACAFLLFCLGILFLFKLFRQPTSALPMTKVPTENFKINSNDIRAIAGDDEVSTQLDLARAYLDSGRKQLAKKILEHVLQHGDGIQQQEAKQLLGLRLD